MFVYLVLTVAALTFPNGILGSDLDVHNLTVHPSYLLLKQEEQRDVKFYFQTEAPFIHCSSECDDEGVSNSTKPFISDSSIGQRYCTARFSSNQNRTKLCTGFVETKLEMNDKTTKKGVKFKIGKTLKVDDRPMFAWKGKQADFGAFFDSEEYPDPLRCNFTRQASQYEREDCEMVINKAAEVDSGRYNVTICVTNGQISCRTFESRTLNVLKKEEPKTPHELRISMFGGTNQSELRIVCAIGCPYESPEQEIVDGKVHLIWNNITSTELPVVQIYLSHKNILLFNSTVRDYEEHPDTHTDGLTIGLIISGIVIVIGIVAGIVIYLYRTKKFCFKVSGNPNVSAQQFLETNTKGKEIELEPLNKKNGRP